MTLNFGFLFLLVSSWLCLLYECAFLFLSTFQEPKNDKQTSRVGLWLHQKGFLAIIY